MPDQFGDPTEEEVEKLKAEIDQLSHVEMARLWRFAEPGHMFFRPPMGEYFKERFLKLGGMTPEISKMIGL